MASQLLKILLILLLGVSAVQAQTNPSSDTKDYQIALKRLRVGTDTARYWTSLEHIINVSSTHRQATTAKAVYDFVIGDRINIIAGSGISQSGTWPNITIANTGDLSTTNELQDLSLSGQTLSLTSDASPVTLPVVGILAGTGIGVSSASGVFTITNTGDTNAADDITTSTTLGGDLSGTLPNPTVVKIQGRSVANTAPSTGEILKWNGSAWAPGTDAGASMSGHILKDDGTSMTSRSAANFISTSQINAALTDDAVGDETEIRFTILPDAITATEIAADAVGSSEIATDAVGSSEIATDAVGAAEIATGAVGTSEIADNSVANADLRQSAALSVIGNATNATANVSDISAGSDHQVLRRSGTGIGFGPINLASSNAVTGNLSVNNLNGGSGASAATSWLGNGTWGLPTGTITGSGDNLRVAYWTGVSTQSSSENFLWDNANRTMYLGVGGNTGRLIIEQTPSGSRGLKIGSLEFGSYTTNNCWFGDNMYWAPNWTYTNTGPASLFYFFNGGFQYRTAPSGSAGSAATQTTVFQVSNAGQACFGGSNAGARMSVIGQGLTGSTITAQFQNANGNNNALVIYDNALCGFSTATPTQTVDVAGNARLRAALYDGTNSAGSSGNLLTSTAGATAWASVSSILSGAGALTTSTNFAGDVSGVYNNIQIGADAVGTVEIATGAVTASELASTAVTAGTYGSATQVPVLVVDGDGRLTSVTNTTITSTNIATSNLTATGAYTLTQGSNTLTILGSNSSSAYKPLAVQTFNDGTTNGYYLIGKDHFSTERFRIMGQGTDVELQSVNNDIRLVANTDVELQAGGLLSGHRATFAAAGTFNLPSVTPSPNGGDMWRNASDELMYQYAGASQNVAMRQYDLVGDAISVRTSNFTLGSSNNLTEIIDANSGSITVTLSTTMREGLDYTVKCRRNATNTITFSAGGSCTFDIDTSSSLTPTSLVVGSSGTGIQAPYKVYTIRRLGNNIFIQ